MPHSIKEPHSSSPAAVKDEPMDEAGIPGSVEAANNDEDDIDMVQVPANGGETAVKKEDVKLDQLFADVDSDEEFPSSAPVKEARSSPQPPASPVYVVK